jgi:hypothetical protein
MTRPRFTLVSGADRPYYRCIGRCVCRTFLCMDESATSITSKLCSTGILVDVPDPLPCGTISRAQLSAARPHRPGSEPGPGM